MDACFPRGEKRSGRDDRESRNNDGAAKRVVKKCASPLENLYHRVLPQRLDLSFLGGGYIYIGFRVGFLTEHWFLWLTLFLLGGLDLFSPGFLLCGGAFCMLKKDVVA